MTRSQYQTLINTLADNQPNTALTVRTILGALADGATFTNELKLMDTTNAYIAANFDGTGLGTNEMLGYAICNGQNGTRDWRGRIPLAYDSSAYPTLGATGGVKNLVLTQANIPSLDITLPVSDADNGGGSKVYIMATNLEAAGVKTYSNTVNQGSPSTPIDNTQPYRVVLYVMKL